MQDPVRQHATRFRHVVLVAGAVNLVGALTKLIAGELTRSVGMSADGVHAALDALASGIALVGISLAARPPDLRHPYGYERYESVAPMAIGGFLVPAYNLEWFGGRFHTDLWFAVMWGGFPALAGAFSQTGRIDVPTLLVCTACGLIAAAQRRLSTPVRRLRRRVTSVTGELVDGGAVEPITEASLTDAPEGALRLLWLAMVALAVGLVITRWP